MGIVQPALRVVRPGPGTVLHYRSASLSTLPPSMANIREELSQLSLLNTGLCRYIETVRRLTGHNDKLVRVVKTLEQSTGKESQEIHQVCKSQIENMKKEKEKVENDLAQLKTEMDVLLTLNQDLKTRNCRIDKDLSEKEEIKVDLTNQKLTLQRSLVEESFIEEDSVRILKEKQENLSSTQTKLWEVQSKVSDFQDENEKLEQKLNDQKISINQQRSQIIETKQIIRDMEKEKLNPVVRNLLGSWHQNVGNPGKACSSDDHEQVWSQLSSLRQDENYNISQVKENEQEAENLERKIKKLTEEHDNLLKMIEDIEKASDSVKVLHDKKLLGKDEEIDKVLEKLKAIEAEVEELLLIKQGLDAEIKIYKTLIDGEECENAIKSSSEAPATEKVEVQQSPCFTFVTNETQDSVSFWCH